MKARLPFVFIIITVTLDAIGIGLILPVMPQLIQEFGINSISEAAAWGGRLSLIYALMQFLFGPMLGTLSDRFGRRPVLLMSLIALGLDYVVMSLAGSLWLLFLTRAIAGITGATYSTASAYLADISPPEKRAANFGLIGASFGIGFIFGPAIGGLLGELGPRAPFVAAAGLAFLNAGFGYFILPETLPPEKRRAFVLRRTNPFEVFFRLREVPAVRRLVAVNFFENISGYVYPAVWAYFTIERFGWTSAMVGASLAMYGVCSGIVQGLLIRPILTRLGERNTAMFGLGCGVLGLFLASQITWGVLIFLFMPIFALSAVADPAMTGMMSRRMGEDEQGELQGILAGVAGLATLISLPLMTQTFSYFTREDAGVYFPGAPFLLAAGLTTTALILLLRTPKAP